jgi:hypothetical protein
MLKKDDIVLDHNRSYWHEAGHVLVARKLKIPVAAVIFTNLKRMPNTQVMGNLHTVYYFTKKRNAASIAKEEAEWVKHFGVEKVCIASSAGMAAEEIYSPPAQLCLGDSDLIKSRSNGTLTIEDLVPRAKEILTANHETLKALATRLIKNGRPVFLKLPLKTVLPPWEVIVEREEINSIVNAVLK